MSIEKQSKNIKGGARPGAGRKKGAPNKKTAAVQRAVEESGITPLAFMLQIMRQDHPPEGAEPAQVIAFNNMRFEAAKAAAPYVHARLAAVEMTGKDGKDLVPAGPVDMLEAARRICFMLSAVTIQQKPQ
jgi:hypothetical protein